MWRPDIPHATTLAAAAGTETPLGRRGDYYRAIRGTVPNPVIPPRHGPS